MKFSRPRVLSAPLKSLYPISLFNVLLILLIFAALSPFMTLPPGLSIALPAAISSEPVSRDGFVVSITKNNTLYLGSAPQTWQQLESFVLARKDRSFKALIRADRQANIDTLIRVWDLLRQAGAAKVYIATNE